MNNIYSHYGCLLPTNLVGPLDMTEGWWTDTKILLFCLAF